MMLCKDCVHYEVCKDYVESVLDGLQYNDSQMNGDDCGSRFVELPCKVGDTVYFNNVHLRYAKVIAIYIDASGGMFDLDVVTNIETVAGYEHFINKDYTFEDIGRRLFLTSEEAEQALKERESNE